MNTDQQQDDYLSLAKTHRTNAAKPLLKGRYKRQTFISRKKRKKTLKETIFTTESTEDTEENIFNNDRHTKKRYYSLTEARRHGESREDIIIHGWMQPSPLESTILNSLLHPSSLHRLIHGHESINGSCPFFITFLKTT